VAITYTWAMDLLKQLPRFLELIEAELEPVLGRKPRCRAARREREMIAFQAVYDRPFDHFGQSLITLTRLQPKPPETPPPPPSLTDSPRDQSMTTMASLCSL
jgi:hypothetical protein